MYDQLKSMLEQRRTPRLVETTDVSEEHTRKIMQAAMLAPSFDQAYAYKIHVLTNSPAGKAKKEQLLKYYRCMNSDGTHPKVTDPYDGREMIQPILSGLTLVYVVTPKKSVTMRSGPIQTLTYGVKDATISATYAMLAAQSLGLKAGMFGAVDHNHTGSPEAIRLFSTDPSSIIAMSVTVANAIVDIPETADEKYFFDYNGERPYVMYKKHRAVRKVPGYVVL